MRHKRQRLLEQNRQRLESYILEHKLNITPEDIILTITEADPDQANFKNSKWLIKNLLAKNFLWEDIEAGKSSKAYDTLSRFVNIRRQWPESNLRDIQSYKGLSGIAEKIRPFEITKSSGELKREEKVKIYSETIVVYDKNDYLVIIPKTEEASCFWGRGTEWCTASTKSKNYFDNYNKDGPLIICITPDNKKYQFHKNSTPMDENDEEITNVTDPVLVELCKITGRVMNIDDRDWTDPEFCKLAVQQDAIVIEHISSDTPDYLEICKLAVQKYGRAIIYISPDTENYSEICKLAVQQNGWAIKHISSDTPDYQEICKLALQQNELAIKYIDKEIPEYLELCKLALQQDGIIIEHISSDTPGYLELCKLALQQNGLAIKHISSDTPDYLELCKLALQQNGLAIKHILSKNDSNIEKYFELCKISVQQNGLAIQEIDKNYINENKTLYLELCNLAVQQNGGAIIFMSPFIDNDLYLELCKLAVVTYGHVIQCIPPDTEDYSEFCKLSVTNNGLSIKHISPQTKDYLEICQLSLRNNRHSLMYIPVEYQEQLKEEINQIYSQPKNETHHTPKWLNTKNYEEIILNLNQLESPHPSLSKVSIKKSIDI